MIKYHIMECYNKIKCIIGKYWELISYVFFGGLTTVVNIVAYYIAYDLIGIPNVPSTIIAWFLSVLFAFVTNKYFVFESKSWEIRLVLEEGWKFFSCRFLTGILDVAIMWYFVDKLHYNEMLMKILSNVIVIVLNFVFSKLLIFKNRGD